jgi:hypothetical protein
VEACHNHWWLQTREGTLARCAARNTALNSSHIPGVSHYGALPCHLSRCILRILHVWKRQKDQCWCDRWDWRKGVRSCSCKRVGCRRHGSPGKRFPSCWKRPCGSWWRP